MITARREQRRVDGNLASSEGAVPPGQRPPFEPRKSFRRIISSLTAATLAFTPACGSAPAGDMEDDVELSPRAAPNPAQVAAEVAELRGAPVVLAPTTPVGALPAESGVDPTGEAHYSIPIEVSPGVRGMQPELTVAYGSNSGDGIFGDRFSLTGLSGISRCAKTVNDDGAFGPVEFDDDDALCLDGERLVLASGSRGEAGAEYRTKSNPFARIVLDHDISFLGGTITYWSRDGRILTYGTTPASLWKGVTGEVQIPWRWNLARQCDRFDNCIDYAVHEAGPLEVHLIDGSVYLFDEGYGGLLCVSEMEWIDPFEGKMTPENVEYVAQYGKHIRVPVSERDRYRDLLGVPIRAVELLDDQFGQLTGIAFLTPIRDLWFFPQANGLTVSWERPPTCTTRERYNGRSA